MNGHISVVEYLIHQKADINENDKNGKTHLGGDAECGEFDYC